MTATQTEVTCPKCGGRMWDNRLDKKNPKAPDFKCRDRSCDGVVWPPKGARNGTRQAPPPPPVSDTPEWLDDQEEAEAKAVASARAATHDEIVKEKVSELRKAYDRNFAHAIDLATGAAKVIGPDFVVTLEGLSAIAATLLIAQKEKGLV